METNTNTTDKNATAEIIRFFSRSDSEDSPKVVTQTVQNAYAASPVVWDKKSITLFSI